MKLTRPPLYLALALLTQCSSCKDQDPSPEEQLPPATQTGANTFGCLVNGQPWTPQGNSGTSNYSVVYDPSYNQGHLSIATYRLGDTSDEKQIIGIGSDSLKATGKYKLRTAGKHTASLIERNTGCEYFSKDTGTYCKGTLTVTRLDSAAGIISGTFDFTLAKPGCDTIEVAQGRFDYHL